MADTGNRGPEPSAWRWLALLLLVIPLALLGYGAWWLYRYICYKRLVKSVNLTGGGQTGQVNERHMSFLLRGEDYNTERGSIVGGLSSNISIPRSETDPASGTVKMDTDFDPLANLAAAQKVRKTFRCYSDTTTLTYSPPEPPNDTIQNPHNTQKSENYRKDSGSHNDHWKDKHGSWNSSIGLTPHWPPNKDEMSMTTVSADRPTAAGVPSSHAQGYHCTTRVLLAKYANPDCDVNRADLEGGAEGKGDARIRRKASATFDSIIAATGDSKASIPHPLAMEPLALTPLSEKLTTPVSKMKK
ncbi:unnamed protein product [Phytomonas sp. Hart1]|nr:unnamed protein product [Phytomonas sp. Hart1]|eukprot:CCW72129.1 unnamed protein product [Phytomonas sp. isolate Hart1]